MLGGGGFCGRGIGLFAAVVFGFFRLIESGIFFLKRAHEYARFRFGVEGKFSI